MALETPCQTPGVTYHVSISPRGLTVSVDFNQWVNHISKRDAELIEANVHNVLELVLAPYFS